MTFNPNQPRVPAGSSAGGEFGKGGGTATSGANYSNYPPTFNQEGGQGNPNRMDEGPLPGSASVEYLQGLHDRTQSLTPSEKNALHAFTYTDYKKIRRLDKSGKPDKTISSLNSALERVPQHDGMMYRGLSITKEADLQKLLDTPEFTLDAVSSFSRSERIAVGFSEAESSGRGVVMRIQSRTGKQVEHLSEYPEEREVIGTKGTTYRVTKKYYGKYRASNTVTLVIEAQEV